MTYVLSERSISRLKGVDPRLVKVVELAIKLSAVDFGVTEGLRTMARQKQLWDEGKTRTLNSRHLTGHAVDLAAWIDGKFVFEDRRPYDGIAVAMKKAAISLGVPIRWGGTWTLLNDLEFVTAARKGFVDVYHFEIPRG